MGSGLILLVIVGAWLAVLVPMALRSHDGAADVEDEPVRAPGRVLPRRSAAAPGDVRASSPTVVEHDVAHGVEGDDLGLDLFDVVVGVPSAEPVRRPVPLAVRRRRVLLGLLSGALVCLLGGVVGPLALAVVGAVLLALAGGFAAHCRRQALLRSRRLRRRAAVERLAARPAAVVSAPHVRGIPTRMPPRPAAPVRVAPPVEVVARRVAGGDWEPVPVPLPTYLGKAVVPRRPAAFSDPYADPQAGEHPGAWSAALRDDDALLTEDGQEIDELLQRRRAVGGW